MAHRAVGRVQRRCTTAVSHSQASRDIGIVNALTAGTLVLTGDGALPVDYLDPGDRVVTRDGGAVILRGMEITRRSVPAVTIARGALGGNRPDRDTVLPAGQQVLLRDWRAKALFGQDRALAPLGRLVDGTYVRDSGLRRLTLIRLIFDAPHIIYADGLELACPDTLQPA